MGQLRQVHRSVRAESPWTIRERMLPATIVGFFASATAVFAVVAIIGISLTPPLLALMLLLLAVSDLAFPRIRVTLLRRQTPQGLPYLSASVVGLVWGLDTGSVVSTYRASAASWSALLLQLAGWGEWWTGAVYAAGFCIPLAVLTFSFPVVAGDATSISGWRGSSTEIIAPRLATLATRGRWFTSALSVFAAMVLLARGI